MITEAQIISIDYNTGTCWVRIPFFETVSSVQSATVPATILILPGIFNGYIAGDLVWVAFENGKPEKPVIIGKIYQAAAIEGAVTGGTVISSDLAATNSAKLPINTSITAAESAYDTLSKLINAVKKLDTTLSAQYQVSFKVGDTKILLNTNSYYPEYGIQLLCQKLSACGFTSTENYKLVTSTGTVYGIYAELDNTTNIFKLKTIPAILGEITEFKCININQI